MNAAGLRGAHVLIWLWSSFWTCAASFCSLQLPGTALLPCHFLPFGLPGSASGDLVQQEQMSSASLHSPRPLVVTKCGKHHKSYIDAALEMESCGAAALILVGDCKSFASDDDNNELSIPLIPVAHVQTVSFNTVPGARRRAILSGVIPGAKLHCSTNGTGTGFERAWSELGRRLRLQTQPLAAGQGRSQSQIEIGAAATARKFAPTPELADNPMLGSAPKTLQRLADLLRDRGNAWRRHADRAYRLAELLLRQQQHAHTRDKSAQQSLLTAGQSSRGFLLLRAPLAGLSNMLLGLLLGVLLGARWRLQPVLPLVYRQFLMAHLRTELVPPQNYWNMGDSDADGFIARARRCGFGVALALPSNSGSGRLEHTPLLQQFRGHGRVLRLSSWPLTERSAIEMDGRVTSWIKNARAGNNGGTVVELPTFVPDSLQWMLQWNANSTVRGMHFPRLTGHQNVDVSVRCAFAQLLLSVKPSLELINAAARVKEQLKPHAYSLESNASVARYNALHMRIEADWLVHALGANISNKTSLRDAAQSEALGALAAIEAAVDNAARAQAQKLARARGRGPVLDELLRQRLRRRLRALPWFVASGVQCSHSWFEPLRRAGLQLYCLPPEPPHNSYRKAVVDGHIAEGATIFVGRAGSSFSWIIAARRSAHVDNSTGNSGGRWRWRTTWYRAATSAVQKIPAVDSDEWGLINYGVPRGPWQGTADLSDCDVDCVHSGEANAAPKPATESEQNSAITENFTDSTEIAQVNSKRSTSVAGANLTRASRIAAKYLTEVVALPPSAAANVFAFSDNLEDEPVKVWLLPHADCAEDRHLFDAAGYDDEKLFQALASSDHNGSSDIHRSADAFIAAVTERSEPQRPSNLRVVALACSELDVGTMAEALCAAFDLGDAHCAAVHKIMRIRWKRASNVALALGARTASTTGPGQNDTINSKGTGNDTSNRVDTSIGSISGGTSSVTSAGVKKGTVFSSRLWRWHRFRRNVLSYYAGHERPRFFLDAAHPSPAHDALPLAPFDLRLLPFGASTLPKPTASERWNSGLKKFFGSFFEPPLPSAAPRAAPVEATKANNMFGNGLNEWVTAAQSDGDGGLHSAGTELAIRLAALATAPWRVWGVEQADANRSLALDPECVLIQLVEGQVWVANPNQANQRRGQDLWWLTRRRNAAVRMVCDAVRLEARAKRPLPDVEFVFCPLDGPASVAAPHADASGETVTHLRYDKTETIMPPPFRFDSSTGQGALPAFAPVACVRSFNIPLPLFWKRFHDFDETLYCGSGSEDEDGICGAEENTPWAKAMRDYADQAASHAWEQRRKEVVFRGSTKGRSCWDGRTDSVLQPQVAVAGENAPLNSSKASSVRVCGRRLLRRLALEPSSAHLYDVSHTYLSIVSQLRYRYILYAEGQHGWADRARQQLLTGSVLLMQESMCREWYTLALEPWVHYVPLEYWFNNLHLAVRWLNDPVNAAVVTAIRQRAAEYAQTVLAPATVLRYAAELLRGIQHRNGKAGVTRLRPYPQAELAHVYLSQKRQAAEPTRAPRMAAPMEHSLAYRVDPGSSSSDRKSDSDRPKLRTVRFAQNTVSAIQVLNYQSQNVPSEPASGQRAPDNSQ